MKKVIFVCMTAGLLAASCDWFRKTEPSEPIAETVAGDSTTLTTTDTTVQNKDSAIVVAETETKKEVKK